MLGITITAIIYSVGYLLWTYGVQRVSERERRAKLTRLYGELQADRLMPIR